MFEVLIKKLKEAQEAIKHVLVSQSLDYIEYRSYVAQYKTLQDVEDMVREMHLDEEEDDEI